MEPQPVRGLQSRNKCMFGGGKVLFICRHDQGCLSLSSPHGILGRAIGPALACHMNRFEGGAARCVCDAYSCGNSGCGKNPVSKLPFIGYCIHMHQYGHDLFAVCVILLFDLLISIWTEDPASLPRPSEVGKEGTSQSQRPGAQLPARGHWLLGRPSQR